MSSEETEEKTKGLWRRLWGTYGLIVVGNIVFFILLYTFSYRPHNDESRSTEFLTLAQEQESDGQLAVAKTLYEKIVADYGATKAARDAKERMEKVDALLAKNRSEAAAIRQPPPLKLATILGQEPAWFLSTMLAGLYASLDEADKPRFFNALDRYLELAFAHGSATYDKLKSSQDFAHPDLQTRYLDLKGSCRFQDAYIWNDIEVVNQNLYPWNNAVIGVKVSQADDQKEASVRSPLLKAGKHIVATDFNITKEDGHVHCEVEINAAEGKTVFKQRL